VQLTHAGDSSGRAFIVEQSGRIRIFASGTVQPTPFLDISDRVRYSGEQGLLSMAFPPSYATKGYFYVYYTNSSGDNQVSRFYLNTGNPNSANPNSEELIIYIPHPGATNHNGGQLAFGPDGYLYIGTGDGGGAGDPNGNGQNANSLLGKILRLDVEPHPSPYIDLGHTYFIPIAARGTPNTGYAIPNNNPFVGQANKRAEIWSLGLRNPWRYSFDRSTGDLYIADVGQDKMEEVDFQQAGAAGGQNYGWNTLEGSLCYNPPSGCSQPANYVAPVTEYQHGVNDANGCSITGGFVYRGSAYPALQGIYFYADYCRGKVWGLRRPAATWETSLLLDNNLNPIAFGEDQSGELYLLAQDGSVSKIANP
jgi:glucose/arabinose dehydrogenase